MDNLFQKKKSGQTSIKERKILFIKIRQLVAKKLEHEEFGRKSKFESIKFSNDKEPSDKI